MNKFLKKYPQFWVPKVGDTFRIVQVLNLRREPVTDWNYAIGDEGEIIENNINWFVVRIHNLNHMHNRRTAVYREEIELIGHE
jgi:hypothetical protein